MARQNALAGTEGKERFENYVTCPNGSNLYQVLKSISQPDDVAWAIVYAILSLYRRKQRWPTYVSVLAPGKILIDSRGAVGEEDS